MSKIIKVLMVDDEEQFRSTTKKILNRRGFETILAASGEEAVDRLKEKPDVVVLDIKMPGMNGHQALKKIKERSPGLPVIMLTGQGTIPSAREALVQGAFDYLAKPCDIDILAGKITDAYRFKIEAEPYKEENVAGVMIPVEDYTTLTEDNTVREAVEKLRESFSTKITTSRIMETGHRSLLVFDDRGHLKGILTILDLLKGIMPAYLSTPKPSMSDSIEYSPLFWTGMFNRGVKNLAPKRIKEVMSPTPLTIEADANLMEAAYMMIQNNIRRLAVIKSGKVLGVIREQDLFFAMERVLGERKK
jgi:DNA-binding response OmpR family regulator